MRNWAYPLLAAAIVVTVLLACTSRTNWPAATRVVPPAIPSYPGAQQEAVEVRKGVTGYDVRTITFRTTAAPQDVLGFYREHLTRGGWQMVGQESFVNRQACPIYTLFILPRPLDAQTTHIELRMVEEPCVDR